MTAIVKKFSRAKLAEERANSETGSLAEPALSALKHVLFRKLYIKIPPRRLVTHAT